MDVVRAEAACLAELVKAGGIRELRDLLRVRLVANIDGPDRLRPVGALLLIGLLCHDRDAALEDRQKRVPDVSGCDREPRTLANELRLRLVRDIENDDPSIDPTGVE